MGLVRSVVRLLIVDDDASMRRLIRLSVQDFDDLEIVGEAENGAAGVQEVERLKPDAVIMDFHMPVMDGVEATSKVKEVAPDTLVVAFTSTTEPKHQRKLLEVGAERHFDKTNLEELIIFLEERVRH